MIYLYIIFYSSLDCKLLVHTVHKCKYKYLFIKKIISRTISTINGLTSVRIILYFLLASETIKGKEKNVSTFFSHSLGFLFLQSCFPSLSLSPSRSIPVLLRQPLRCLLLTSPPSQSHYDSFLIISFS